MKHINIEQALNDLGKTSTKVYQTLKAKGIKGNTSSTVCPVARYLQLLTGKTMSVGPRDCNYTDSNGAADVDLPAPVRLFIRKFDEGKFPDLVG